MRRGYTRSGSDNAAYADVDHDHSGTYAAADGTRSAFAALRSILDAGDDPVAVTVQGGSTGNDTNEWVYEAFDTFGTDYPAYSVLHLLWDDTDQSYGTPTELQEGTAGDAYIALDGTGDYATTPDSAAVSVTGDIDIRIKVALDDWTPAAGTPTLFGKFNSGQRSWRIYLNSFGQPNLQWSTDGSAASGTTNPSAAPTVNDGDPIWLRVTVDVDDGASQHVVTFYTSADGQSWTQLGTQRTLAGTTSFFDGTSNVQISGRDGGTDNFAGKFYYGEIRDGIDGEVVLSVDAGMATGQSTFQGLTGETWTLAGDAAVSGAPALVVYNASTPGETLSYSNDATRFAKQAPVPPMVSFINYGHNDGASATLAADYTTLVDAILSDWPQATVVAVAQNPQVSPRTAAQIAAQRRAMTVTIPGIAASKGLPLLDAYTALSADTATYIDTDGVHPTAAGSDVWRDEALTLLRNR